MATNYKVGALSSALTGKAPKLKSGGPIFVQTTAKKNNGVKSKPVKEKAAKRAVQQGDSDTDDVPATIQNKKKRKIISPEANASKRKRAVQQDDSESDDEPAAIQKKKKRKIAQTESADVVSSETSSSKKKKARVPMSSDAEDWHTTNDDRTIFVGNLPAALDTDDIRTYFEKFGKITRVRLQRKHYAESENNDGQETFKRSKKDPEKQNMAAYIVFETKEMAQNALKMNSANIGGLHVRVDWSKPSVDHKMSVFIGNVSYAAEEEDVRKHFSVCGDIVSVRLIRDRDTGAKKGFGYVSFKTRDALELALKLDTPLLGRTIRVQRSTKDAKNKPAFRRQKREYLEIKKKQTSKKNSELKKSGKGKIKKDVEIRSSGDDWQGQKTTAKTNFRKDKIKKKHGKVTSKIGRKQNFKMAKKPKNRQ